MSAPPRNPVGRAELALSDRGARDFLRAGWPGHRATVGADGWRYVLPMLYAYPDDTIYMHHARHDDHLARNLAADARACFSVDAPGEVYAYGRFECDSPVSYTSVIAFGSVSFTHDPAAKALFFDRLTARYGVAIAGRPAGDYPPRDAFAVFGLRIASSTGKRIALPADTQRWPLIDSTRSPGDHPAE